ncbi:hypothetical protein ELQ90_15710 [Labedella phragmitis]|uniref:Uncharacterized protein n=1 Tax=Labedella phragmitis TaxID=2498849 RepID=A0A444PPF4_9MICO|nr:hypothetical protein [Labedella phragmitis]RWZ46216.1 hypothetical protein ELQ90_15710 [Labedella phragmitis]
MATRRGTATAEGEPGARAERLKERVYVTFTSLAVVLALVSHAHDTTPGEAATTLLIAVVGTLLAVFVADFVSHIAAHEAMPTSDELRHMAGVSMGAVTVLVLPLVFLGLAALDVWTVLAALRASAVALIVSLVAIGFLAVRRVKLPVGQRLIVLLAEAVLGLAVIGLELLAHG